MKKFLFFLLVILMTAPTIHSQVLFPDSQTARSEVELGVEGIRRLCPTGMWDHWTFKDVLSDRESNTVIFVIQLHSWREKKSVKEVSEADVLKETEWIVANFKEGYEGLIENPSIQCDGDFMLYLSVGTLFKQMEKDSVNLRIMLIKPDYVNQVCGDFPMALTSEQLKIVKAKE